MQRGTLVRLFALAVALAALAAAPAGLLAQPAAPEAAPMAAPTPAPTPAPTAAAAAPSATPSTAPTPNPYAYVIVPPDPAPGLPAILEIAINDRVVHSGGPYAIRVTTTLNVTSVEIDAYGARFGLQPAGPGRWTITGQIPEVPVFFRNRTYTATFVAWAGTRIETNVDVSIRVAP